MKTRAAAKGRRLSLLAAVSLISTLFAAPAAEASRSLPAALAPVLEAPVAPAQVLEEEAAEPSPRYRLFGDLSLPERPLELVQIQKTASGVLTCELRLNVWQLGGLSQNRSGPTFQGLWTDPVTGIAYARNRWYDARTASWLSEDPKGAVDSPNLYAFVGWGPHTGRDPMGMLEQKMYEQLIEEAYDAWMQSLKVKKPNYLARGKMGELVLERLLDEGGMTILKGPAHDPNQRYNSDVIAVDETTLEIYVFDNKVQGNEHVRTGSANNLTVNQKQSLDEALANLKSRIDEGIIDEKTGRRIGTALRAARQDPSRANWLLAFESHAEIQNLASKASKRLVELGVRVADVDSSGNVSIRSGKNSAGRRALNAGKKALGALAVVGIAVDTADAAARSANASLEDETYRYWMISMGKEPTLYGRSLSRELAVLSGELSVGEAGSWGFGALGALGGSFVGPWGTVGGAVGGSVLGGTAGSAAGGYTAGVLWDWRNRVP